MKKLIALILVCMVLAAQAAVAEIPDISGLSDAELTELSEAIIAEQNSRGSESAEPVEIPTDISLSKGSKGDDVQKLQARLIELNYLEGKADGSFGGKTEAALKTFQAAAGLSTTGVADAETLEKVYAEDAPKAKVYNKLNFKEISRDPNAYKDQSYSFSGRVLQVMEGSDAYGTTSTVMRIATKGRYDNVVYVTYERPNSDKRILEDDKVTVYGICDGLYTYETIMGGSVTLPKFTAEIVSFD